MAVEISSKLKELLKGGGEFLGCQHPIICGAMTWVSEPNLISAVCEAGGFASIAGGNAPTDILKGQVEEVRRRTDKAFGVNLITIAPAYAEHLKLVSELKVPYIIFAGSFPKEKEIAAAKASGAKVMCFASTLSIAERMLRFGSDAIILEGNEAGGHIGHVSAMVLLQQVLMELRGKIPVFVAGGIATGKMFAHLLLMGASGIQMGTRFVMTEECRAHPNFKEAFKNADARDAVATPQYDSKLPVVAVRSLRNKGHQEFGQLQLRLLKQLEDGEIHRVQAQEEVERFWIGALRKAVVDGDVKQGSLMAGQSVGMVDKITSTAALMDEMLAGADAELAMIKSKLQ